ncbi:MAG TPA: 2-hydroxyacid dehydrogenase [Dermatophilaceae bacterium]|nr:2-hydroxyacid dehydrogenase [Dermatophilaceae bacterium]HOA59039.1 2-hydroxyacid dehydrogenase [Dermatophilaceae bacterium]HOF36083.1 2-hydroxyacid dehydrogenase [Dermatophilaceae bacterium]HOI03590.1 2-hydroxyacid dehydrogenase [Dermatophilaceae bacterium]HOR15380.1 2-hydroxyacid dehydrogenase [Dermatophilaceae bacterium]
MRTVTLPGQSWITDVGPVDGLAMRAWDLSDDLDDPSVRVVVPPMGTTERLARLAALPGLEVVQLFTAGYDHVLAHLPSGVTLCNAAGVHDASTAEFAVALMLAAQRGIPEFARAQERGEWIGQRAWPALGDRRVLIVGYGRIGRALAARLAPFEVSLTAVASRPRAGDDVVERVHGFDELPWLLPHHDIVVLLTPLTDTTRGLADAAFLASMPDGALVVNVARGQVLDTAALLAETATGRLRAALDVTDPEPLPPDHPLWHAPGVLVAPHVGGAGDTFRPRMVRLLREQLTRYAAGAPLLHVVAGPGA